MTVTLDMTVLAVVALAAGVVAFIVPRLLGYAVGAALLFFAAVQLVPLVSDLDLREAMSQVELSDLGIHTTETNRDATEIKIR